MPQSQLSKILLLLCLLVVLVVGAIPGYMKLKWAWMEPPPVPHLQELRELQNQGIRISGWQAIREGQITMGSNTWWSQELKGIDGTPAMVLLRPQKDPMAQPEVEWMDINGYWRWQVDAMTKIEFIVELGSKAAAAAKSGSNAVVTARFFRGWTGKQTYAVLQWYAFPNGGKPAPSDWFWGDRLAQLAGDRLPWVAACIIIPIEPLGNINKIRPTAESLGQIVQTALMAGPLKFSH
ncbi:MAG TPA: cyanoexosortase B system-associated protein [Oscillatoriaceae cyanobacterium M33_DOE_052]|uniref:Cyanoexosortase B system-associated protein n=1 Tax=Planktothricoides sp. SpSt-374 TaxID=2282167 RepID=A0A7C3ZLU6_9CYAN|nr:cyanoexosortase B system-associated protein [Oscillatoriaceae cyanobacterium M33_DOE_052]